MKYKIHRCNCREIWSVQNRKTRFTASSMLLKGEWETELKPERKYNPKGFVVTRNPDNLIIDPTPDLIDQYEKTGQLLYNKNQINFNVMLGKHLLFAEDGACYILKKI